MFTASCRRSGEMGGRDVSPLMKDNSCSARTPCAERASEHTHVGMDSVADVPAVHAR